ncbi:hypothetical protein AVEN_233631-1 [Araneus ventricosus]|uniref:Uncharacterized protein n=1 Tax=Araneus ventricosus TaxID=182803 RepID=A0A4Y2QL78_ARAVE|nr:hypothetical protein AVEN_233631-1 [Araneus ventricosus]
MPSHHHVPGVTEHLLPVLQLLSSSIHEGSDNHLPMNDVLDHGAGSSQHDAESEAARIEETAGYPETEGLVEDELYLLTGHRLWHRPLRLDHLTAVVELNFHIYNCKIKT